MRSFDSRKRGLNETPLPHPQVSGGLGLGYMATSSVFLILVIQKSKPSSERSISCKQVRGSAMTFSLRKEVIQPQVLLRLPCYDFTPIMNHTLDGCLLAVSTPASSAVHFRDVTGGVYKARERIHRGVLIRDY
jgi:hypothetical protein